ncbi:MAG TPA: hypothetical protein VFE33_12105 [Thermoanaerobaculia bacterium]|nr:hypothetical protein [Thermoanaerobaculia bacterium]
MEGWAAWTARTKLAGHPRPDHRRPEDRAARSATVAFEIDGELFEQPRFEPSAANFPAFYWRAG